MARSLTRVILKVVTGVYQPDTGHTVTLQTDEGSPVLVTTATESPASSGNYVATWAEQEKYGYWYVDGGVKAEWGRVWLGTVVGNVNYLTSFNVLGTLGVNGAFDLTGLMTINNSNLVTNFNADLLDGLDSTAFLLINNTGSIKHSDLQNLTYAASGHTGFESSANSQFVSQSVATDINILRTGINNTGSVLTTLIGHVVYTDVSNIFTQPQTIQSGLDALVVTGSLHVKGQISTNVTDPVTIDAQGSVYPFTTMHATNLAIGQAFVPFTTITYAGTGINYNNVRSFTVYSAPSGSAATLTGHLSQVWNSASGTVSNIRSFDSDSGIRDVLSADAIVTNVYHYFARNVRKSGAFGQGVANSYGLYITSQTNATNAYGVYIEGANDKSYFAGKVGIGLGNTVPTSQLDVSGSIAFKPTSLRAGEYTVVSTDSVLLANAISGSININLPAVASFIGRQLTIKKIDASLNLVNVTGSSGQLIDGQNIQSIATQYVSLTILNDGSAWYII